MDVFLIVSGHPFEAAYGHRLLVNTAAPAGGLTRPVTDAAQDAGEHIGVPVDHVGVTIAAGGDQTDVFGNGGVCRTGVLAIHDFVKIVGTTCIGRIQSSSSFQWLLAGQ
jgi:hypothetical protein